jgi:hypothetical protein
MLVKFCDAVRSSTRLCSDKTATMPGLASRPVEVTLWNTVERLVDQGRDSNYTEKRKNQSR